MCVSHLDPKPGWRSSYPRWEGDGGPSTVSRAFGGVFQTAQGEGGEAIWRQNTSESEQTVTFQTNWARIIMHHAFIIHSAIIIVRHSPIQQYMDALRHSLHAFIIFPQDGLLPHNTSRSYWLIMAFVELLHICCVWLMCCMFACMHVCLHVSSSWCWDLVSSHGFFLTILWPCFDLLTGDYYLNMLLYNDNLLYNDMYCEKHYRNLELNKIMAAIRWLRVIVQLQC